MAKKAFDILPPYPEKKREYHRESPAKKQKKKSKSLFFSLILAIFVILLIYIFLKAERQSENLQNQKSNNSSAFELFNNQGQSSLTQSETPANVKITNGSPKTSNAIAARDALLNAGFEIAKFDAAGTQSQKTIIYYASGNQSEAIKAKSTLSGLVTAEIQESSTLESGYNLSIIVGDQ